MLRKINRVLNLYLCQGADWQYVVETQDEENAATLAIEAVMLHRDDNFKLSSAIVVKKLSNNLIEKNEDFDNVCFYAPTILANAGFHIEANNLHAILLKQGQRIQDEP